MSLLNAADQIKAWANKNRAILVLADELERIGSLEQAAAEQTRAAAQAKKQADAEKAKLAKAQQAVKEAEAAIVHEQAKATTVQKQAKEYADAVIVDAETFRVRVIEIANAEAKAIVTAAQQQAATEFEKIPALRSEISVLKESILASRTELQRINDSIATAKQRARDAFAGVIS